MTDSETEKTVSSPHDALFRKTFRQLENWPAVFSGIIFPKTSGDTLILIIWKSPGGTYVDEKLRDKHSDIVYRTKIKGLTAFLYILFEHQNSPDPMMVFRLLCYTKSPVESIRMKKQYSVIIKKNLAIMYRTNGDLVLHGEPVAGVQGSESQNQKTPAHHSRCAVSRAGKMEFTYDFFGDD